MTSAEVALELAARRLEGDAITRVIYVEPWPGRAVRAAPGEVGLAVYLALASGRCLEVRWADQLRLRHGFGLALRDVAAIDPDLGRLHEASAAWADHLGVAITSATVRWRAIEDDLRAGFRIGIAIHADHLTRADYPRALELRFASGRTATLEVAFTNQLVVALA